MSDEMYTIGEISRLSGQPVRRIRFYSDRGLLALLARDGTPGPNRYGPAPHVWDFSPT